MKIIEMVRRLVRRGSPTEKEIARAEAEVLREQYLRQDRAAAWSKDSHTR